MTGGGSIFDLGFVQSSEDIRGRKGGRGSGGRITHGFQLRCDLSLPSRLQINWDTGNSFHLTELTVAECDYDLEGFPQFYGEGIGKCNNGEDLISVTFTFSDQGPGYQDLADIIVQCYEWTSVIVGDYYEVTTEGGEVSIESDHRGRNNLDRGNHQAHDWDAGGPAGADVQAFVETALEEVTTVTITYKETSGIAPTDPYCTPLERGADSPGNDNELFEDGEIWVYTCTTTVETNQDSRYSGAGGNQFADGGARRASAVSSVSRTAATDHSAGTVSFTFSSSNHSQDTLSSPSPSGIPCDPLVRIDDDPGNDDDLFEPGETWVYTCSSLLTVPVDQDGASGSSGSADGSGTNSGQSGSTGGSNGSFGQSGSSGSSGQSGSAGGSSSSSGQSGSSGSSNGSSGQSGSVDGSSGSSGQSGSSGSSNGSSGQSGSVDGSSGSSGQSGSVGGTSSSSGQSGSSGSSSGSSGQSGSASGSNGSSGQSGSRRVVPQAALRRLPSRRPPHNPGGPST